MIFFKKFQCELCQKKFSRHEELMNHQELEHFKDKPYEFVEEPVNSQSNYWLNALILKDKEERDSFLHETNSKGVTTRPIWTLMNKLSMFKGFQCGELSNAEWLEERVVNIPSSMLIE